MFKFILSTLAVLLTYSTPVHAEVVSSEEQLSGVSGRLRYSYDDSVPTACDSVMIIGVGTAMNVNDYDLLSSEIATDTAVVSIIVDHSPWWFVKTNSRAFANLANAIAEQITDIVPVCKSPPSKGFIVGGHSASGQAALGALPLLSFSPVGFFGLDPYRIDPNREDIGIPAMFWGFSETTCQVTVNQAAKGGYQASNVENRVLYQVQNPSSSHTHCAFTDAGCFGSVCPTSASDSWVRASVGDSASLFIEAIATGNFNKENFDLSDENVKLFVNEDRAGDARVRLLRGAASSENERVAANV